MNTNYFVRELWTSEFIKESSEVLSLLEAGLLVEDSEVSNMVNAVDSGKNILIPYIQEGLYSEATIMDESNTDIVSQGLLKVQLSAPIAFLAKAYGEKTMSRITGSGINTLDAANTLFSRDWGKEKMHRMINSLAGAVASNKTNNASDNVVSDNTKVFDYGMVVDAQTLAGDQMNDFVAIAVHPTVYGQIKKNDAASVTTVFDSALDKEVELYNGMRVILSKAIPNDGTTVTSFLLKPSAFVYATKMLEVPVESVRNEKTGNGAGSDEVVSRNAFLLTLNGYDFTATTVAGDVPTVSELADGTNWSRKVDAGLAPFVAIESKA